MSSNDKQADVAVQRSEDGISEKEKKAADIKSDISPQKRSASEMNNTDEVKQKLQKTEHKKEENGSAENKYEEDGEDEDDDVVPDDYDEGEEGAEDEEDEEEDEA